MCSLFRLLNFHNIYVTSILIGKVFSGRLLSFPGWVWVYTLMWYKSCMSEISYLYGLMPRSGTPKAAKKCSDETKVYRLYQAFSQFVFLRLRPFNYFQLTEMPQRQNGITTLQSWAWKAWLHSSLSHRRTTLIFTSFHTPGLGTFQNQVLKWMVKVFRYLLVTIVMKEKYQGVDWTRWSVVCNHYYLTMKVQMNSC